MTFLETEVKELGRSSWCNTHNTRLLIRTSQAFPRHHCRQKKPLRWKSINTHVHTRTHTHTLHHEMLIRTWFRAPTVTNFLKSKWKSWQQHSNSKLTVKTREQYDVSLLYLLFNSYMKGVEQWDSTSTHNRKVPRSNPA